MTSDSPSRLPPRLGISLALCALVAVSACVLLRLSLYGIWDPWELSAADPARKLVEGTLPSGTAQTLSHKLIAAGFSWFGIRDWAGRLPIALCGLLLLPATFIAARRFTSTRTAVYATLVLATTPFFAFHSRLMVGAVPAFLASTLVFGGAAAAVFPAAPRTAPDRAYAWLGLSFAGALLGASATGILLSVLPAILAVAIVTLLLGPSSAASPAQRNARYAVLAASLALSLGVIWAVFRRDADASLWLGGVPNDGSVPTYELSIAQLFHSFAPWSALLPVALGALLRLDAKDRTDQPLRLLCVAWAGLGYAAQSLFISSYGSAPFPAPVALAIAVALWLGDRDEERKSFWPEALLSLLFVGLVLRDYALYPASPLSGLALGETPLPASFNPKSSWALLLVGFAVALVASSFSVPKPAPLELRAPYQGISQLWARGLGHKAWLSIALLALLGLLAFGTAAWIPSAPLTSIARRIGRAAFFVPLALPAVVALGQLAFSVGAMFAPLRHGLLFLAALSMFAYASQGFLPLVSQQFSPREMLETYNRLAGPDDPLVQHQVPRGAAHYYARGEVRELATRNELIDYLSREDAVRKWAAFPTEHLAEIDQAFRRRTKRHLFLPASDNAKITLVSSQPIANEPDQNPLTQFVLSSAPSAQFPVNGRFEDSIELIGYNLDLPAKTHVGAGQVFHVTWIWRALKSHLGAYKIFLHVDAPNHRINGDHEPVDGKYPVRLWDEGDVILDRQQISVPATSRPGKYTLNVGFHRGETRLKVTEGTQDGTNRLIAGSVEVR